VSRFSRFLIGSGDVDPIGGCEPHKSYLCEVAPLSQP